MNEFVDIPKDLLQTLLFQLKGPELINLCQSSPKLNQTCLQLDDTIWINKFLHDYGPPSPRKPVNFTWRQFYYAYTMKTLRPVEVKRYDQQLAKVLIYRDMTYRELINILKPYITFNIELNNKDNYTLIRKPLVAPQLIIRDKSMVRSNNIITLDDTIDYENLIFINV